MPAKIHSVPSSLLALLLLLSTAATADVIERSFDVGAQGKLEIDSDIGSINIESQDANKVEVRVVRQSTDSQELKVDFKQEGSTVRVTGDLPDHQHGNYHYNV